ncbi:MAG: carbohydrate kinase [bacterium]
MKSLSFGEVLWDLIDGKEHIGGAPFNVAAHLSLLGYESFMLTRVGRDRLGNGALAEMDRLGVVRTYTQLDGERTTGWAKVSLDASGSATFAFPDNPAYNFISADSVTLASLKRLKLDAICFGTLVQKGSVSRASLLEVLKAASPTHVFYDVNIRMEFYPLEIIRESLSLSTIVKLNDDELPKISVLLYGSRLTESAFVSRLSNEFPVEVVCVTRGSAGCAVHAAGEVHEVPGIPVKVVDTVGAGDAFSAAFLRHYVRTGNVEEAAQRGNLLGAYVASQAGAVPEYSAEIRRLLA